MKKLLFLLSAIMLSCGSIDTYANVDQPRITEFRYECRNNREGILHIVFNLSGHHSYYRDYKINHQGFIEVKDANHTSIDRRWNLYIPGCGCPEALTGVTRFASYSGTNTDDWGIGDYGQTTTSGWDDTWVFLNGPIMRTTTVVSLYPVNNGVPEKCPGECKDPLKRECRLSSPQTTFYTNTGGIRYRLMRDEETRTTNATGSLCKIPAPPKIECTAGSGARILALVDDQIRGGKTEYIVDIPGTIASQVGKCTLTHTSNCERERKEVIDIIEGGAPECRDPSRTPDCILTLEQKNFTATASGLFIRINSNFSLSSKCKVPPPPSISCKIGTGAMVLIAVHALPEGGIYDPLDFQPIYSVSLPKSVTQQANECTLSYPPTACLPAKQEKIIISNPPCRETECLLTVPQGKFFTRTGGLLFNLLIENEGVMTNGNTNSLMCKMPTDLPIINCTAGTGARVFYNDRTTNNLTGSINPLSSRSNIIVSLPRNISSKTGTCTLTYISKCNPFREEMIELIGGGAPECSDPNRKPDCTLTLGRTTIATSQSGYTLPILSSYSSGAKCMVPSTPSVQCLRGTGARVLTAMPDMPLGGTVDPLDYQARYTLSLPGNVTKQYNECTLSYPATPCMPAKDEKLVIRDANCDPLRNDACTLSLTDTLYNTTSGSLTVPLNYNNNINLLGTGQIQTLTCDTPKIPDISCTAGNTGAIRIVSNGNNYSLILPPEIASKEGSCTLSTVVNTCGEMRTETFSLRDKPVVIETGSVTEERVCFRVRGAAGNAISGLKLTVTMRLDPKTYISFRDNNQRVYTINDVEVVGDQYCVNIPGGGGGPGGPVPGGPTVPNFPGPRPFTITIQWCNDPYRCTLTQPGGFIITPKKCSGYLEVLDNGTWNRDGVLYNKKQSYRVHMKGEGCSGDVTMENGTLVPINGTFSGTTPTSFSLSGNYKVFDVTIKKPDSLPPNTLRGLKVKALYDDPEGFRYGLTESDVDWLDTPLSISGTRMNGVYIIGNTSGVGQNIYNQNNASNLYDVTAFNTLQNTIRQNVSNVTRGIPTGTVTNKVLYYKDSNPVRYSTLDTSFDTLIVEGGDLILDSDIPTSKGIIVLKSSSGIGGNVIVGDGVTSIQAVIFAEGIMRGPKTQYGELNVDSQLVLKGALYSKNTIGGSADPKNLFLYPKAVTSDRDEAFMQDLNNLRTGNGGKTYRGIYTDAFIIEYDGAIAQSPFPGFTR